MGYPRTCGAPPAALRTPGLWAAPAPAHRCFACLSFAFYTPSRRRRTSSLICVRSPRARLPCGGGARAAHCPALSMPPAGGRAVTRPDEERVPRGRRVLRRPPGTPGEKGTPLCKTQYAACRRRTAPPLGSAPKGAPAPAPCTLHPPPALHIITNVAGIACCSAAARYLSLPSVSLCPPPSFRQPPGPPCRTRRRRPVWAPRRAPVKCNTRRAPCECRPAPGEAPEALFGTFDGR